MTATEARCARRTSLSRDGLALAACHSGDTLVVPKLDRLARSLPDTREILDELIARGACTTAELAELFSVNRATVYRTMSAALSRWCSRCAHFALVEEPDRYRDVLTTFLDRVEANPA